MSWWASLSTVCLLAYIRDRLLLSLELNSLRYYLNSREVINPEVSLRREQRHRTMGALILLTRSGLYWVAISTIQPEGKRAWLLHRRTSCFLTEADLLSLSRTATTIFLFRWTMTLLAHQGARLRSGLLFFRATGGHGCLIHSKPAKTKVGPVVSFWVYFLT